MGSLRKLVAIVFGFLFTRRDPDEVFKHNPDDFGGGRYEPYTVAEISLRMCELNRMALTWLGDPDAERKHEEYVAFVGAEIERKLDWVL